MLAFRYPIRYPMASHEVAAAIGYEPCQSMSLSLAHSYFWEIDRRKPSCGIVSRSRHEEQTS